MKFIYIAGLLCFTTFFSCQYSPKVIHQQVFYKAIPHMRHIFDMKNLDSLRLVCTDNGYSSLLEWTDSLKNEEIPDAIVKTLSSNRLQFISRSDSTFTVMVGRDVPILNEAPMGNLTIIVRNHTAKIDAYSGEVVVH